MIILGLLINFVLSGWFFAVLRYTHDMSDLGDKKNDAILLVLRDKDIFPDAQDTAGIVWKDRPTGKVVLFNKEGQIALIGNKVNGFFLLPGGGIEPNESVEDGIKRECLEETGCGIEFQNALGVTEDYRARDGKHCTSYGYSAKAITYGEPTLTDSEADIGAYVKWLSLSEAVKLLALQEEKVKAGEVKFYNTCFNTIRDLLFLRRANDLARENQITPP
jgi:ADP-ribose pyrophosphatase YjhB (NUDIX family)